MIVERHYDDEALIAILDQGTPRDPHLAVCSTCADTLASFRTVADVLRKETVWDFREHRGGTAPDALANIRAFASRIENEAATAEVLIEELLSRPRSSWLKTVSTDARYSNDGVVRLLVERSEQTIAKMPPDGVALIRAAVELAERLDSQQLRGSAWRQYAYALFYTGDYSSAANAVDVAEAAFEKCAVADYEIARVRLTRALICTAQGEFGDAHRFARQSAAIFRAYGDRDRLARAMGTEAYSLLVQCRYAEALPILRDVHQSFQDVLDDDARALTLSNIGICLQQTGSPVEALEHYQLAASLYEMIGSRSEATRARQNVACILASQGQYAEAKRRLRVCQREFDEFGMPADAVCAGLDLAEILLGENDYAEVETLCRRAIDQYTISGVPHSALALTALTFLQEAAKQRRATPAAVRHVKHYLERLPGQPSLLFAPPPLPLD